jgi:hypothetical protein
MLHKDSKLCICIENKVMNNEPYPDVFTEGRAYYYYKHGKGTIGIYGKNNLQVYGMTLTDFKKHFIKTK